MIEELKTIKSQLNYSSKSSQLENKLHMTNDTLITYGISLKVYLIQKKFRILNLTDQQKRTRKTELTSCVSKHFNSMHVVRALNENSFRRNFTPAYVFIGCTVSKEYCDNYYFSSNPKSAFVARYDQGKTTKQKETFPCHYCDVFLDIKANLISILNVVWNVPVLFIAFRTKAWKLMRNTFNAKKIFH